MKQLKLIASVLVVGSVLALNPIGASAEWRTGSVPIIDDGEWCGNETAYWYAEGNSWATGWRQMDGEWYYFDPDTGYAADGWKYINGKWYCFQSGTGTKSRPYMRHQRFISTGSGKYYYVNSDGVYINNPTGEIKVYLDLIQDNEKMKKLGIIDDKRHGTAFGLESDHMSQHYITDNNKDGVLEINISARYKGTSLVEYRNGMLIVNGKAYSSDATSTITKNIVDESGLQFDTISGKIIAYRKDNGSDFAIPDNINGTKVKTITNGAFMGCTGVYNLKTLTIPETITSIEKNAFGLVDDLTFYVYSDRMKKLVIDSGVKKNQVIIKK